MLFLTACNTSSSSVNPTFTPLASVSPNFAPTSTITTPPTRRQASHATYTAMRASKGDGTFLVGVEIAVGIWASSPSRTESCFWARRKANGVIFESYFGPPTETTISIQPGDYEFETLGCGTWTFVSTR